METEIIAHALFGPARPGDNGAGLEAHLIELTSAAVMMQDTVFLTVEQETWMWQGLLFQQIQDFRDSMFRS